MFLVMCSAVASLACHQIDRPAESRTPKSAKIAQAPPTLLTLTCELSRSSATVSCTAATPSTPAYAQFHSGSVVNDTVAHTWQFDASVQNLLEQAIGTLDGSTVTGVKVFITDFHVTSGAGTVSVVNADGTGNVYYNEIVAPNKSTSNRLWTLNVPNTVTSVSLRILISTDFPAEQNVTALPPDTKPAWFNDDSSWAGPQHDDYLKRVIGLCFRDNTTLQDRQLAVAYVDGTVVGGAPMSTGDGCYYVQVADDGSGTQLGAAISRLKKLPQVEVAAPLFGASVTSTPIRIRPSRTRPS